jgi:hypothetical protein
MDQIASGAVSVELCSSRLWPGYGKINYDYKALFTEKVQRCDCDDCIEMSSASVDGPPPPRSGEGDPIGDLSGRYVAISYTWGPCNPTQTVLVNGMDVQVTVNLHAILVELRSTEWVQRGIRVWIDGLCINQSNLNEREEQVQVMREIYLNSWQVIICLGPATDQTATAYAALLWLSRKQQTEERLKSFINHHERWHTMLTPWSLTHYDIFPWNKNVYLSLRAFFAEGYWHRLWILQELAAARSDAPVLWGTHSMSLKDVWTGAGLIDSVEQQIGQHITTQGDEFTLNCIGSLKDRRIDHRDGSPQQLWKHILRIKDIRERDGLLNTSIISILQLCRLAGAVDQRDKVYGLLGLPSITSIVNITPDYHLDVSEIFINFTRELLIKTDLAILRLVYQPVEDVKVRWKVLRVVPGVSLWIPRLVGRQYNVALPCPHDLPSWVVCCTCSPAPAVFLPGSYHADRGLHTPSPQAVMLERGNEGETPILQVQAVLIDRIATLSAFNRSEVDRAYPHNCDYALTIPNAYGTLEGLREALWRSLVANSTSSGEVPAPLSWACLLKTKFWNYVPNRWDSGPGVRFGLVHFWLRNHHLVLGGYLFRELIPHWDMRILRSNLQIVHKRKLPKYEEEAREWATNVLAWRRLIGTCQGRIGLTNPAAKAGDSIMVVKGCNVPMVFRPDGAYWRLIGECYLHGIMDGEVAERVERGESKLINLEIR